MKILYKQFWHLLSLLTLLYCVLLITQIDANVFLGSLWGIKTKTWFILSLLTPIVHQIYVLLSWRYELHYKTLSTHLGQNAFNIYRIGFLILFAGRLFTLVLLALSNKDTLYLGTAIKYFIIAIITLIVVYAFYSIYKYFGINRAVGLDHFDNSISKIAFVRKGIFKYTDNGMYLLAFLIFYLPSLLLLSKAAMIIALFSHLYIWVHYFFTELPDIKIIYRNKSNKD